MFLNSMLLLFLIVFSAFIFFINNLYIILSLLFISLILCLLFKVHIPLYWPFLFVLFINFLLNYLLASFYSATLVTSRLFITFLLANLIIKKIGVYNLGYIVGHWFKSNELTLIISISLSFIPIMMKELSMIKKSLISKGFSFNFRNIVTRPDILITTFFTNLFKRVNEMEKVLLSKGVEE